MSYVIIYGVVVAGVVIIFLAAGFSDKGIYGRPFSTIRDRKIRREVQSGQRKHPEWADFLDSRAHKTQVFLTPAMISLLLILSTCGYLCGITEFSVLNASALACGLVWFILWIVETVKRSISIAPGLAVIAVTAVCVTTLGFAIGPWGN